MRSVPTIETDRLFLRAPRSDDIAVWATYTPDPDFRRYVPVRKPPLPPEEGARRYLARLAARWETDPLRAVAWVFERRSDGQLVGAGGLEQAEAESDGEIDYFLGKPFWGQGYGGEAAHAMTRFALDHIPWERVVAYVIPENVASVRIAQSLGMVYEGEVDYRTFFPDPSAVELAQPMAAIYAVQRAAFVPRPGTYHVAEDGPPSDLAGA